MIAAIAATALGVMIVSIWAASSASRNASLQRLKSTGELCVNASYPLSSTVLSQIQDLSGLPLAIFASPNTTIDNLVMQASSDRFPLTLTENEVVQLVQQSQNRSKVTSDNVAAREVPKDFQNLESASGETFHAMVMRLPSSGRNPPSRFLVLLENTADTKPVSDQAFVLPLVTGIFASVAIALIAGLVANRIGSRIERLNEHVVRIAGGSFSITNPEGPNDAIRSLHESVNRMSLQLEQSANQIASTERSRLINLLASGLSHELRNRLAGARLAIQTYIAASESDEGLEIALKQMELAEATIRRLLAISADRKDNQEPPLSASQILSSVVELTRSIVQHQSIQFSLVNSVPAEFDLTKVMVGQGASVVSALINLVLNAIEAAGPNGRVELHSKVSMRNGAKALEWQVCDSGPGPALDIQASMFEPFSTTKREGVGLGLAMCKQLAESLHGGIRWERVGAMTQFTLDVQPESWEVKHATNRLDH